jgi:hypothetical protein
MKSGGVRCASKGWEDDALPLDLVILAVSWHGVAQGGPCDAVSVPVSQDVVTAGLCEGE